VSVCLTTPQDNLQVFAIAVEFIHDERHPTALRTHIAG
jgi:hypothetical protein